MKLRAKIDTSENIAAYIITGCRPAKKNLSLFNFTIRK